MEIVFYLLEEMFAEILPWAFLYPIYALIRRFKRPKKLKHPDNLETSRSSPYYSTEIDHFD